MSTNGDSPTGAPALLHALVDDAAIFPPGNAPMPTAVFAHREHASGWFADLLGPFLCADQRLPELQAVLADTAELLPLSLVVTGGAGAIEPALRWAGREPGIRLCGLEVALRSTDDLVAGARRIASVLAAALPDDVPGFVEIPRPADAAAPGADWLAALDVLAEADLRVKYRTGGLTAGDFPSEWELAGLLEAALDRELAVKCTAGLHRAVRRTAPTTGFEEHGFLNVALATRAALDGADRADVAAVLARRDRDEVAESVRALSSEQAASTRRWFTSFGSCSVTEPLDELVELGLFSKEMAHG
jgi:hypothetical protein